MYAQLEVIPTKLYPIIKRTKTNYLQKEDDKYTAGQISL